MLPADATFDMDGRVRFSGVVSAASIGRYRGDVLLFVDPYSDVDPDRVYDMLRDPAELRAAAPCFNGLPILSHHTAGAEIPPDLVCGAVGSDCAFDGNMVRGTCTLWSQAAIDSVATASSRALSMGFEFKADMTPGTCRGQRYDGRFTEICPRHVALVPFSKSGVGFDGRPQQPRREAA